MMNWCSIIVDGGTKYNIEDFDCEFDTMIK